MKCEPRQERAGTAQGTPHRPKVLGPPLPRCRQTWCKRRLSLRGPRGLCELCGADGLCDRADAAPCGAETEAGGESRTERHAAPVAGTPLPTAARAPLWPCPSESVQARQKASHPETRHSLRRHTEARGQGRGGPADAAGGRQCPRVSLPDLQSPGPWPDPHAPGTHRHTGTLARGSRVPPNRGSPDLADKNTE